MATDNIQDNSPEMPLDDPRIQEILTGTKAEPAPEKTDVKVVAASSAETQEKDKENDADPDTLKAQIKGLQAELSRRKGNAERVEALEDELKGVKAKLSAPKDDFDWIRKLDDDGMASKQTDWDDELADARARYGRAEEAGDDRALERQGQRILTAKRTLSAFRKEALDRVRRQSEEQHEAHTEAQSIQTEIADMRDVVEELLPDVKVHGSDAWNAGNEEFITHPQLMKRLGPLGEVVACAMALVRNPNLLAKNAPAARREVIGSLEKVVKKSLSTGASSPLTTRSVDHASSIQTSDGLASFNAMIDKIKGG